jgi:hypothetical protein
MENVMSLELWNETPDLPADMTSGGEISEPLWARVFAMDGGDGARCKVWVLRADALFTSPALKPDASKQYAVEAEFDGHMEQKLVVGSANSHALFQEMEAYLKEGSAEAVSIFSSGH